MKRLRIVAALAVAGLGGFLAGRLYESIFGGDGLETTVSRLSPDEMTVARLGEAVMPFRADRHVSIRLERRDGKQGPTTLFHSPDEGRPAGTERLIWSKDGTMLLVVGRHFFVKDDLFLDNGDQLYLLHHRPSGRSWSNAAGDTNFPPLKAEQVVGIEFTEPVVLKPLGEMVPR